MLFSHASPVGVGTTRESETSVARQYSCARGDLVAYIHISGSNYVVPSGNRKSFRARSHRLYAREKNPHRLLPTIYTFFLLLSPSTFFALSLCAAETRAEELISQKDIARLVRRAARRRFNVVPSTTRL